MKQTITFYDKVIIAGVIALTLFGYGVVELYGRYNKSNVVTVHQYGSVIFQVKYEGKKSEGIYPFNFDGGEGFLEIKDGKARMLPMDKKICPNGICSEIGWIKSSLQVIACTPNNLLVKFDSSGEDELDGIT